MNPNRHTRTLTINSLEVLDERIVPSSLGASVAAKAPIAIDIHFSGVTSKTLKSFEKELANDKVKLGSISLKTDIAVGTAPKSELASIAGLKHVTHVSLVTKPAPATAATVTPSTSTPTSNAVVMPTVALSATPPFTPTTTTTTDTPTKPILAPTPPVTTPTPTAPTTPTTPLLLAKGGSGLSTIYSEFETDVQAGSTFTPTASQAKLYFFSGTSIKLDVSVAAANLGAMVATLEQLGMTSVVTALPGQVGIIEGFMPIAQLPTVADNPNVIGMPPALRPTLL